MESNCSESNIGLAKFTRRYSSAAISWDLCHYVFRHSQDISTIWNSFLHLYCGLWSWISFTFDQPDAISNGELFTAQNISDDDW